MANTVSASIQIPLSRLQLVSDLIFVFAMTMMVFNIELPDASMIADLEAFKAYFANQLPSMALFIVSFAVVAVYWMKHVIHFSYLQRVDVPYAWRQIFLLIFVTLLPLTNNLVTLFPEAEEAMALFSANLILIGACSLLSWQYAYKHQLLIASIDDEQSKEIRSEILSEPTVALISLPCIFISPAAWGGVFIFVPALFGLRKKMRRSTGNNSNRV